MEVSVIHRFIQRYPSASLVSILAGLQRHINTCSFNKNINFLKDSKFVSIRRSLDAAMKISAQCGKGLQRKSSETLSKQDEQRLWDIVLGSDTAEKMLDRAAYFVLS